ncbi:MAG TPA: histidine--tRNA ligase [Gammaproteobacteria bacterium]|nr:histidine--tRNA ligase [Gammaproteobacteria bacterium]
MATTLQSIRGMNDLLPSETPLWQALEAASRAVLRAYGFEEVRFPLLEQTAVFARSIGEHTDIVEKEMYTFEDRNGDSLSLRPEGTAGCVRAMLEHGLLRGQTQRLWYMGPMFRHERPQKGRYRQFHQIGVEAFGMAGPDIDAELILMTARLWRQLELKGLTLQINSLGSSVARAKYRAELVRYFSSHEKALDADSHRRLTANPLRILDSKNPAMADLIAAAPAFADYLDAESAAHFESLQSLLKDAGVPCEVNPRLVRGLDYYGLTVFEWVTRDLGAQGAVCAGGRYDGLVELFGGPPTPAVGFALGMERLIALWQGQGRKAEADTPAVYLMPVEPECVGAILKLAEQLRDACPGLQIETHCGGGSLKSQFKRADRVGAKLAVMVGGEEQKSGKVTLKDLRSGAGQQSMSPAALIDLLKQSQKL